VCAWQTPFGQEKQTKKGEQKKGEVIKKTSPNSQANKKKYKTKNKYSKILV
jgi:hypothetical protein